MSDKPCPLCGREMTAIETHAGYGELYCVHCDLTIGGNEAKTPDELMGLLRLMTCTLEINTSMTAVVCNKCNYHIPSGVNLLGVRYCPHCGAKVVNAWS